VGRINEAADKVWLADLTANYMKEGTTTRTPEQVAEEAATMGGRVSLRIGADTGAASIDVLSEFAPNAVVLVADVLQHPAFPEKELPRLKSDLLRQLAVQKSQPRMLARERFASVHYPNHPYGRSFPTEGMLKSYTLDDVKGFYNDQFGAARTHLYVCGTFDDAAVRKAISAAFSGWKKGPAPMANVEQAVAGRRLEVVEKPGAMQSMLIVGLPVVDIGHPDYIPLSVMNAILGGSFVSRLASNIREQKGYTYGVGSMIENRNRTATWSVSAAVGTAVTGASLKEIFYEIGRLRNEPPTADEVNDVHAYLSGSFVLQNSASRAFLLRLIEDSDLHGLGADYLRTYVQKVNAVTASEIQAMADKYLLPEKMTIVIVGDAQKIADQIRPWQPSPVK
jgi:predicted Zn-dependent peptidase